MGELVSVKTLTKIIERDKAADAKAVCAECGWNADDPYHDPCPLTPPCDSCHDFAPNLSRAAKDRRLLIRTLNTIADEWGTFEEAAKIDRMMLDLLFPVLKVEDCD